MSRQPEYIGVKGGNVVAQFFLDRATNTLTTASLVSGTNMMDLGHLANSSVKLTPNVTKYSSEDGVIRRTMTTFEGTVEGNAMQTSKEIGVWLGYTTRSSQLLITYKLQGRKNGKWQEFWAVGENDNGFSFDAPDNGTGTPFKFNVTPRDIAVSLTTTQIGLMKTALYNVEYGLSVPVPYPYYAGAITIAKDVEFEITETTG